jgi:hypothetical protein
MKSTGKALTVAAAIGASYFAWRAISSLSRDVEHYNRIRAMSGQGPFWDDVPDMLRQIVAKESRFTSGIPSLLASLPKDLARYMAIEAM